MSGIAAPAAARVEAGDVPRLPGTLHTGRLDNGLRLCVLENRRAPVVSTALWLAAGCRHERADEGGIAHLLEHLMFKGAARYGPGEIDRITQARGGRNNAFTSHDATVYTFSLSASVWQTALDIEADRMAGPTLDPAETERERQVVLEEIAMYENEPWDVLEQRVHEALYRDHPYGRPILGRPADLRRHRAEDVRAFFDRWYRMSEATLVVAGDVDWEQARAGAAGLGTLPVRAGGAVEPPLPAVLPSGTRERVTIHRGDVARMLLGAVTPPSSERIHGALRVLALVLAGGRSSRLVRDLVEERRLCLWVSADVSEAVAETVFTLALEVTPGVAPKRVERELLAALERLRTAPPSAEELARARRMALADWLFAHERTSQQALAVGRSEALFGSGYAERALGWLLVADDDELARATDLLQPDRGLVIGWSLPE